MKAAVTGKDLYYAGSIGIDKKIMSLADILPGEQVHVLNVYNGERIVTYAIEEKAGSGKITLYGPAARTGEIGDELVILTYCYAETGESKGIKQKKVILGKGNKLR
jgi:aspartate 1-decarboxylase